MSLFLRFGALVLISAQQSPALCQILQKLKPQPIEGDNLTCTFEIMIHAFYQGNTVTHDAPRKQSKPLIVSFTDLGKKNPGIRSLDVVGGVDERTVLAVGNAGKYVLIDVSPNERNVDVFTIYKASGVAVWTRSYDPFGLGPTGRVGIGKCR